MTNRLVWLDTDNYLNLRNPATGFVYDFHLNQIDGFDYWINTLQAKKWVTAEHIALFREIAGESA